MSFKPYWSFMDTIISPADGEYDPSDIMVRHTGCIICQGFHGHQICLTCMFRDTYLFKFSPVFFQLTQYYSVNLS